MLTLPASGRASHALSGDYEPQPGDLGKILIVTASGSPVTITLPGTLPAGFWCFILRNAASSDDVEVGALRTLTAAGELCEIFYDGAEWLELQRGSSADATTPRWQRWARI